MKTHSNRYPLSIAALIFVSLAFASQPICSAIPFPPLNLLGGLLDEPPHLSVAYLAVGTLILLVGGFFVYLRGLDPFASRRSLLLVWINGFGPALLPASWALSQDVASASFPDFMSLAVAPAAGLLPPTILLLGEQLAVRIFRGFGQSSHAKGWRKLALRSLLLCLRLRPGRPDLVRQAGLLYLEEDEFEKAIRLLAMLGSIERSEDDQILRALDKAYRACGQIENALTCLLRQRQLQLNAPGLDKRILDDYLKLDRNQEALELLESGRLKPNFQLLQLRQQLNVKLGNYAQALVLIQKIAEAEGSPHAHSSRLYKELMELLPDNLEIRIHLGQLLLNDDNEDRRREGAQLLEDALAIDPHRLHLSRQLLLFYREHEQPAREREHMRRLVEADDPDPEPYLQYARVLADDNRLIEAAQVMAKLTAAQPNEHRGHLRLARLRLQLGQLDEAEAISKRAEACAPADALASVQRLQADIEQARRKQRAAVLAEDVAGNREDIEKRLALIDEYIELGDVEKILKACDELLDEYRDQRPAVEQRLNVAIERIEHHFRLQDYLADLYFEGKRFDDLLDLYRRMARHSLHPAQIITEGCQRILERAPGHVDSRLELAVARRLEQDWQGVLDALAPLIENGSLIHAAQAQRDGAPHADGRPARETPAIREDDVVNVEVELVGPATPGEADEEPPAPDSDPESLPWEIFDSPKIPDLAARVPSERDERALAELIVTRNPVPQIDPADKALYVEAAFKLGHARRAIEIGRTLVDSLADEPGFMMMMIDILQSLGEHEEAHAVFLKARAATPDDQRLTRMEQRVVAALRDHRLAVLAARMENGLTPEEHYEKAELHRERGQLGEAVVHYQRAADHHELARLALAKMAASLCDRGMFELAEEIMDPIELNREVDEEHPELKELIYQMARTMEKIKKPQSAIKFYKRIFHVDASYKDTVNRLEHLSG